MARLRWLLYPFLFLLASLPLATTSAQGQEGPVYVLTLKGIINPAASSYVQQGIKSAQQAGAEAVVLQMDTPGGLDQSMRDIVQAIDNASVPVIVYVTPRGARAASAGAFIAMAGSVTAMAPGTTIGSATPVSLGWAGQEQDLPPDLRNKVVNDAVSYIRAHAEMHGRNADWAEQAVREGSNLTASQALDQNVVDLTANDLPSLLQAVDGRTAKLADGQQVTLHTASAPVVDANMSLMSRFLHTISDPNIAFILLILAFIGIFFELLSPGLIIPGVAGVISLLLALYALGTLDAYWGGVVLVALGFVMFGVEIFTPTHGLLGLGGVAALVVGALMLFANSTVGVGVSPWLIGVVAALAAAFFLFMVRAIVVSRRKNLAPMGYVSLLGAHGVARTDLTPEGTVLVQGERWDAISEEGYVPRGTEVIVHRVEGLKVYVQRKKEGA